MHRSLWRSLKTGPRRLADISIDHFEGLETIEDLPRGGKKVSDYWF